MPRPAQVWLVSAGLRYLGGTLVPLALDLRAPADFFDATDEVAGTTIGKIVPVNRRDDDVLEAHFRNGLADASRFVGIDTCRRLAG